MVQLTEEEVLYQLTHAHEDRRKDIIYSHSICIALAAVAVLLRFLSRYLGRIRLGPDDWTILAGFIFGVGEITGGLLGERALTTYMSITDWHSTSIWRRQTRNPSSKPQPLRAHRHSCRALQLHSHHPRQVLPPPPLRSHLSLSPLSNRLVRLRRLHLLRVLGADPNSDIPMPPNRSDMDTHDRKGRLHQIQPRINVFHRGRRCHGRSTLSPPRASALEIRARSSEEVTAPRHIPDWRLVSPPSSIPSPTFLIPT